MTDGDDRMDYHAEVRAVHELTTEEITEIKKRLRWLEAKVVEVLWAIMSGVSMFAGWAVATWAVGPMQEAGLSWWAVGGATWLAVGFWLYRTAFKGAPDSVDTNP